MKFYKQKLNLVNNVFDNEFINQLNKSITKEIKLLKNDYKSINIDDALIKETRLTRALSYRVFNDKLKNIIEKKINSILSKYLLKNKNQKYLISPLIYFRRCKPQERLIKNYKKASFYTEPHYDRSFDKTKFYSIWIPLKKTDFDTGTLCYFNIPGKIRKKHFPVNQKNKFSIHNYFQKPEIADKIVSNYTKPVYLNTGDILFFNQYCLHGATKSTNKTRYSVNFQVFDSKVLKSHNYYQRNKFVLSNYSFDVCNLLNLLLVGDKIGAKRIHKKIDKKKLKKVFNFFKEEDVRLKIKKLISEISNKKNSTFLRNYKKNLHYSKELSFLNN